MMESRIIPIELQSDYMRYIQSRIWKARQDMYIEMEEYISLHIQPKPWWLPKKLWYKLLSRILFIQRFQKH